MDSFFVIGCNHGCVVLLFSQGAFLNHLVIAQGPQEETESVENFVTLEEPTVQTAFCQMFLISVG